MSNFRQLEAVSLLHIGKTGGNALRYILRAAVGNAVVQHRHTVSLRDIWASHPERRVLFIVRDPVSRFVSAFNSRLRRGRPLHNNDWSDIERVTFERFANANMLAESLFSPDADESAAARSAMEGIGHLRRSLAFWLGDVAFLEANRSKIAFIGLQPCLSSDLPLILQALRLPPQLELPADDIVSHRTPPNYDTVLSELGRSNVARWYADDWPLFDWCMDFRGCDGLSG